MDLSIPKNKKPSSTLAPGAPVTPTQLAHQAKPTMPPATTAQQQAPKLATTQPASSGPPQPSSNTKPQPVASSSTTKSATAQPATTKPQATTATQASTTSKPTKQSSATTPSTTPSTAAKKAPATSGAQSAASASASASATTSTTAKKDTTTAAGAASKQPAKSSLTPEQQKKLDDLRKKVLETRQDRLDVMEFVQSGRHMAEMKQSMERTQATGGQDALNKELTLIRQREERLVSVKLEIRREEIIKELNNLKSIKKPDAAIQQEMKKLEADQKKIVDQRAKESADLKTQLAKVVTQIEKDLPQEMSAVQRDIDAVMNSKTAVSIRQQKLNEQLNAAKVQSSTLIINAKKLESKLTPTAKTSLEPADIESFDAELGKIENRQRETLKLLPVEEVPETPIAAQPPPVHEEEAIEDPSVQRPLSPTQSPDFTPIAYYGEEQLESPQPEAIDLPSAQKSPGQSMDLLTSLLGTDLAQEVTQTATEAAVRTINDDKADFVARERRKIQVLEEDKLTSMKKVVAYKQNIRDYPARQKDLASKLTQQRAASELLTEVLEGICRDEVRLREVKDQLEAEAAEMEPPAEEGEYGAEEAELLHGEDQEWAFVDGEAALEDGAPLDQEYLQEEQEDGTPPVAVETTFELDAEPIEAEFEE